MLQVVEQDHFLVATGGSELPARRPVTDRDRERQLRRAEGGPGDADTARDQRPQHGEKPPRLVSDRTGVSPVRRDAPKAIQYRLPRHAHLLEPEAAIGEPVQSALVV